MKTELQVKTHQGVFHVADEQGFTVLFARDNSERCEALVKHCVQASNSHDSLVKALANLAELAVHMRGCRTNHVDRRRKDADQFGFGPCTCGMQQALEKARDALALVGVEVNNRELE